MDQKSPVGPVEKHLLNLTNNEEIVTQYPAPNYPANFLLTKQGAPVYAVVNGFLVDLARQQEELPHTLGY